ncbi:MAG: hypothetical protein KAS66_02060 [Candidatus Omnitrophica bacterium]|nr:hypothetical protein [Candidatus Omnitrophota bacterium]
MSHLDRSKRNQNFFEVLCVISSILVFLIIFAIIKRISLKHVLTECLNAFYSYRHNLIFVDTFAGINVNLLILFLIITISFLLAPLRKGRKNEDFKPTPGLTASCFTALTILSILAFIQTVNFTRYLYSQSQAVRNKTTDEKKALIFGDSYTFARFCKKRLPGRHNALLITDIDLHTTTGANTHIALAYHLFPITIQYNPRQRLIMPDYVWDDPSASPIEALVVFQKKNPEASVPGNFNIIGRFGSENLLAVRK